MYDEKADELNILVKAVRRYGRIFILSKAGSNWDYCSGDSSATPDWIIFYRDLLNGKFEKLIDDLINFELRPYYQKLIMEELISLIEDIKETVPKTFFNTPLDKLATKIKLDPVFKQRFELEYPYLYSKKIFFDFSEDDKERDSIITINPVNDQFKHILLDKYGSIVDYYTNFDQRKIRERNDRILNLENDLEKLKHELIALDSSKITLEIDNRKLSKANEKLIGQNKELDDKTQELKSENTEIKLKKGDYDDDINLPKDISFRMVFLWRLGLLEPSVWPNSDLKKIGKLISMFLTSKGEDVIPISAETITRYRNALLNYNENATKSDSKALDLIKRNDEVAIEAIKKTYNNFDPKTQKFLLNLENKDKTENKNK